MDILIACIYAAALTAIIYRWRFFRLAGIHPYWMVVAFLIKLVAGFALWKVYTTHYSESDGGDATRYYHDAQLIRAQLDSNPQVFYDLMLGRENNTEEYAQVYDKLVGWYSGYRYGLTNDYRTIVRLQVLITFISFQSYHVHWIIMAFLAFIGLAWIYKSFEAFFRERSFVLFAAVFLLPSVIFWSAGLLKEGPTMLGLGLAFYCFSRIMQGQRILAASLLLLPTCFFLFFLKQYVLFAFIPSALFLLLIKFRGNGWMIYKFIVVQAACFLIAQNAHHFFIGGDFLYVLGKKKTDFYNSAVMHDANSLVTIPESENTFAFVKNYPAAFGLTFFRPFLWESKTWMYMLFALENACYAAMLLSVIFFFRKPENSSLPMILAALSFALVMASIIGNCVPVLGSVVRYRIVALPFFAITCFYFTDYNRLRNFFSLKKVRV